MADDVKPVAVKKPGKRKAKAGPVSGPISGPISGWRLSFSDGDGLLAQLHPVELPPEAVTVRRGRYTVHLAVQVAARDLPDGSLAIARLLLESDSMKAAIDVAPALRVGGVQTAAFAAGTLVF